ncbi:MAG TPA: ABC transporter permease, partial [Longimicrobiales bacterium]|nr:ABC transporter permease [Longimicrobiales bacterium]
MEPRQDGDRALPLPEQIFLRLASLLVPRGRRAQWQREWEGELFELARRGAGRLRVLAFLAGAVPHGMWERKEEWTVDSLMQDFRFAGRTLRRSPGFSLAAVTILALAIGGTTAIYGFLEAAVLRAPPYPAPDRLVMVDIVGTTPAGERTELPWSYPKYRVFAEASPGLDGFAAFARRSLALTGAGQPVQMPVELVTSRYFSLLGTDPVLGRTFTPDEDDPAAAPRVALLSYGLWRSRFGADSTLVGRTVNLNHVPLQVVGVLPPGFDGLTGGARAWVPLASAPAVLRPNALEGAWRHWFRVVGRLPGGLSLEAGRDAVAGAGTALGEAFTLPTGDTEWSVGLEPFAEARVNRTARVSVLVLFGAVLLILLVACANVAGLLLARAADRGRETAVRA